MLFWWAGRFGSCSYWVPFLSTPKYVYYYGGPSLLHVFCYNWPLNLPNEQLKACSDILFNALSGRPHQSLQLSSTALSCRAIFMFLWIRQSFIHKTHALSSSFSKLSCEKICVFFLSRILLNISPPDFVLETEKNSGKRVKFDSALFCCDDEPWYDGP